MDVTIDDGYNYVMLSLNGSVLFESGSAEIQKDAKKILNRIGDVLKMYPKNTIKTMYRFTMQIIPAIYGFPRQGQQKYWNISKSGD